MNPFKLKYLDHIAIRVRDMQVSQDWYEKVLGMEKGDFKKWEPFPIFMLAGDSGVALFPANSEDPSMPASSRNVKIDHFAFNVSNADFEKAQRYFKEINEPFEFQDHFYYHSIYLNDPDNHIVELTTQNDSL